jgi:hypothetical protein
MADQKTKTALEIELETMLLNHLCDLATDIGRIGKLYAAQRREALMQQYGLTRIIDFTDQKPSIIDTTAKVVSREEKRI